MRRRWRKPSLTWRAPITEVVWYSPLATPSSLTVRFESLPQALRYHTHVSMKDRPLVSAIIATYNRGYVVDQAIESVLSQTYENVELIVVDDGSIDGTQEILRQYGD